MIKYLKFLYHSPKRIPLPLGRGSSLWLCGSGEQQYWQWMEYREQKEEGNITVTNFDYWGGTKNGKNFGKGDILCPSGRLTDDSEKEDDEECEEDADEDS